MPAFTNGAGGRGPLRGSLAGEPAPPSGAGDPGGMSDAEQSLLDAALAFYGAAETVIDYAGPEPPRVRYDVGGLQQVRDAMGELEDHVRRARDAGLAPEQIARITRLDDEIVTLILARAAEPPER
jgi:hypothetical protein